jgi:DNA polymerase III delta' subunit
VTIFSDILGQDSAISALCDAYRAERMPHAMLFAGPVGVGKATTARALGALWLCEKPKGDSPCGKCESCRMMEAQNHPDCHIIVKELIRYHDRTGKSKGIDLSINVIRPELVNRAALKSAMGRGKVFVIEQAELLNTEAQNAMLKTLEEPLGRTIIVLLTDQPGLLLPTIRSRCRTIQFASLSNEVVKSELKKRKLDSGVVASATTLGDGSLGLALKWIHDGVISSAEELTRQLDAGIDGKPGPNLPDWLKKSADAYAEKQLERDELASKDQATREGLAIYLKIAAQRFRRLLGSSDDPELLERAATAIDAIVRAENYLDSNVNVALTLQQLAISLERAFAPMEAHHA